LSLQDRKKILLGVADALEANEKLIKIENEADVAAAQQAGLEKSLISRLALKPGKVRQLWIVYLFMFFLLPLPTIWFLSSFIFHLAK
jgi:gamma-glutamyl phosphate reductase